MQGKHLTQKERFYIEKRRGDGINQATIAKELELPRSTITTQYRPHLQRALLLQKGVYSVSGAGVE